MNAHAQDLFTLAARTAPAPRNRELAAKLRTMADSLTASIADKFRDRETNTPKRMRQAGEARNEGRDLERGQRALIALADAHAAGACPALLAGLKTKAAVLELARERFEYSGGYYDHGRSTGRPNKDGPEALALWAMVGGADAARIKAEELRAKIERLQFAQIPGYFPTPAAVVARMMGEAMIGERARVLEPSAGSGAILDYIKVHHPCASLVACERHASLREILTLKGFELVGSDFLELTREAGTFDRIVMNPPFENGQDIEHIRHAFDLLAPHGRLVAIASMSWEFRQDRKFQDFRAWFNDRRGVSVHLPSGSFKASGTGVETTMLTLYRPD